MMKAKKENNDKFSQRNENNKLIKTIITDRFIMGVLIISAVWLISLIIPIILYFITFSSGLFMWLLIDMISLMGVILFSFFALQKRVITLSMEGLEYQIGKKIIFSMKWISFNELELHRYKTILPAGDMSVKTAITKIKFTGESGVQDYKIDLTKIKIKVFLKELIRFAEIMNKKLVVKKSFEDISKSQAILEEFIL